MKGIILAGGNGTRLRPLTSAVSKQLLPVYDKPMIYYPLSVLMLAGIREVLIITTPRDLELYRSLLEDGSQIGISIEYRAQSEPKGLADAFILGADFIGQSSVMLVLGDNIFWGLGFTNTLQSSIQNNPGATIFGYEVKDPERFGVVECDDSGQVLSIQEKPEAPASNIAITGLYIFDNKVVDYAKLVRPSPRGELEITALHEMYLADESLAMRSLGRGFAWLDTGTHQSLLMASNFVEAIESRQALKIACIEEIALGKRWINSDILSAGIKKYSGSDYGRYLEGLLGR